VGPTPTTRSWTDPDDKIAIKLSAFVAVDATLAPLIDSAVPTFLTPDLGFGGALRPRTYNQEFKGDGARYVVAFRVS
jgi:hypothetical protein